jgi:hypothetical protein
MMSRRADQQRSLNWIERTLLDDLRLGALFEFFTWLTRDEAMPPTERAKARPWRRLRPAMAAAIGLTAVVSAIMLSLLLARSPARGRGRGGPGRLALLRGRIRTGLKAAEGPHLGSAWPDSGGE